jgi:hypothetical protein
MVRLYPRARRERYEEEFEALLEERPASASDICAVAVGAFDAWLFPQVVQERSVALMGSRMRRSVLLVFWAWVGVAMVVVSVATAVWGLALWAQAPALLSGDDGILATPTVASWLAILMVMAGCACLSIVAAVRGLKASGHRPDAFKNKPL